MISFFFPNLSLSLSLFSQLDFSRLISWIERERKNFNWHWKNRIHQKVRPSLAFRHIENSWMHAEETGIVFVSEREEAKLQVCLYLCFLEEKKKKKYFYYEMKLHRKWLIWSLIKTDQKINYFLLCILSCVE